MKRNILYPALALMLLVCSSLTGQAKKMEYTIRIFKIVYNGDTLQTGGNVVRKGIMKKHTKRLPIATLDDGTSLHLEFWLTVEGVMLDRFNVFQHKYYVKTDDTWRLMAVSPRLKFPGRHYDRGHYHYRDPRTDEQLEVFYELIVEPYKKKKKKKKKDKK